jgi:hypothetical protein
VRTFIRTKHLKKIEIPVLLTLFPALCYFILPAQHEGYIAMAATLSFVALLYAWDRPRFTLFIGLSFINLLAFVIVGENAFRHDPFGIFDVTTIALLYACFIGYLFYLLYKNSRLYRISDRYSD